jgi:hypothetical protein
MAKGSVTPHPRERKTNPETHQCAIYYDQALMADRGCFSTFVHTKRKPRSVRPEQRKQA